ncbi:SAM-dependent methyltransferase [Phytohabitans sp. ZYX-F-186]|uniref:SAM-dependent methyltransferase n=1 Tax=Phytohabitans maris TaxID=3071409 RepID=A0ABU0ZRY7_9ACTN|nr:SAM-dependent methyltransferase [Phytohabitans sp. ZYX-F-186]MDQ7909516.1 SAM-dependent methyltransferase [Phytohabitans sp. ZYX-F-186]
MDRPAWAPPGVDLERPSTARIYDYMLGGLHNFAVDRQMAEQVLAVGPQIRLAAHANRGFLRRAVEFLAGTGIRQFLDLGSGIPTVGNVHEAAHHVAPDAKVVYVDVDPVAVAHSLAIVEGDERVTVVRADIRDPETILKDPRVTGALDFTQPVAVLIVAVLHFVPDSDDPAGIVAKLRDAIVPGSYIAISQVATFPYELSPEEQAVADRYTRANAVALRTREQIATFFDGLELVEPGLVDPAKWRADGDITEMVPSFAGVGRKP